MAEGTENISDDIYASAISNEAPPEQTENTPETPTEAPTEAKEERARDDKGRFVSATPEPTSQEAPVEVATEAPVEEKPEGHQIPSWRLKEEADARREAIARAEIAERQAAQFQQALWQMQQQLQKQKEPEQPVDIFADPQGWEQSYQAKVDAKMREMEANMSLRLAAYKHGDTFHQAYQDMARRTQMGDDAMRQQVMASPDPGEKMVEIYKREQVISQVGDDPQAFLAKALEEALNNPEYLARAVEKAKASAGGQSTPANKIQLPPSINKATSSAPASGNQPITDAGIYDFARSR